VRDGPRLRQLRPSTEHGLFVRIGLKRCGAYKLGLSRPKKKDEIDRFFVPVLKAVLESLGLECGTPEVYKMIFPEETQVRVRRLAEYQNGTQFFVVLPLRSGKRDLEAHLKFRLDKWGKPVVESSNLVSADYFPNEKPRDAETSALKPWIRALLPTIIASIFGHLLDQYGVTQDLSSALPIVITNVRRALGRLLRR
jgi:hypothetical protein